MFKSQIPNGNGIKLGAGMLAVNFMIYIFVLQKPFIKSSAPITETNARHPRKRGES